jgi:hypothetical protein
MVVWLHCLWACGEAEHHDGEHRSEQIFSPCGSQGAEKGTRESGGVPTDFLPLHSAAPVMVSIVIL